MHGEWEWAYNCLVIEWWWKHGNGVQQRMSSSANQNATTSWSADQNMVSSNQQGYPPQHQHIYTHRVLDITWDLLRPHLTLPRSLPRCTPPPDPPHPPTLEHPLQVRGFPQAGSQHYVPCIAWLKQVNITNYQTHDHYAIRRDQWFCQYTTVDQNQRYTSAKCTTV